MRIHGLSPVQQQVALLPDNEDNGSLLLNANKYNRNTLSISPSPFLPLRLCSSQVQKPERTVSQPAFCFHRQSSMPGSQGCLQP